MVLSNFVGLSRRDLLLRCGRIVSRLPLRRVQSCLKYHVSWRASGDVPRACPTVWNSASMWSVLSAFSVFAAIVPGSRQDLLVLLLVVLATRSCRLVLLRFIGPSLVSVLGALVSLNSQNAYVVVVIASAPARRKTVTKHHTDTCTKEGSYHVIIAFTTARPSPSWFGERGCVCVETTYTHITISRAKPSTPKRKLSNLFRFLQNQHLQHDSELKLNRLHGVSQKTF